MVDIPQNILAMKSKDAERFYREVAAKAEKNGTHSITQCLSQRDMAELKQRAAFYPELVIEFITNDKGNPMIAMAPRRELERKPGHKQVETKHGVLVDCYAVDVTTKVESWYHKARALLDEKVQLDHEVNIGDVQCVAATVRKALKDGKLNSHERTQLGELDKSLNGIKLAIHGNQVTVCGTISAGAVMLSGKPETHHPHHSGKTR